MHMTHIHSHFYLRRCVRNHCEACAAATAARRLQDPDWDVKTVLHHLRYNNYHMYFPGALPAPVAGTPADEVPRLVAEA